MYGINNSVFSINEKKVVYSFFNKRNFNEVELVGGI